MRGGRIKKIIYTHIINIYRRRRRCRRFRGLRNENYWFFSLHYYYYDYFIFRWPPPDLVWSRPGPGKDNVIASKSSCILYCIWFLCSGYTCIYLYSFLCVHVWRSYLRYRVYGTHKIICRIPNNFIPVAFFLLKNIRLIVFSTRTCIAASCLRFIRMFLTSS